MGKGSQGFLLRGKEGTEGEASPAPALWDGVGGQEAEMSWIHYIK